MENQFVDLLIPNLCDRYCYINILPDSNWSHLSKLVLMVGKFPEIIDVVKKTIIDCPNEITKMTTTKLTPIIIACLNCSSYSSIECVKLLIESGANVNDENIEGWTSLMFASANTNTLSSIECVKLLIESGANVNHKDTSGCTSLMFSSAYVNCSSSIECIQLLIDSGANVNDKDNGGWTSLVWASANACSYGSIECVQLLIDRGAKANYKDDNNRTALMYLMLEIKDVSLQENDIKTIMILIHASKLTICDKDNAGKTAYDYYIMNNNNILLDNQLCYLSGEKVLSKIKSSRNNN